MKQEVQPISNIISAKIFVPGSKSITNRAFLLAAFANGVSEIFNIQVSEDTRAFAHALRELGIVIQLDEKNRSCIIAGAGGRFPKQNATIHCKDSGTTARFLLAACAASPGIFKMEGSDQLSSRPMQPLLQVLKAQGAHITPDKATHLPLTVNGADGIHGGEIEMDGSASGQFASAILMIAPFAKTPVLLQTYNLVSRPFVTMTCMMMSEFGVLVRHMHRDRFSIPIPQRYTAREYIVEPDLTTASYFFAAAAITGGEIKIQTIDRNSTKQGDAAFLSVLEKMGCIVTTDSKHLTVKGPKKLSGVSVDMRDFSDTFMTLAAIAPFAESPTTITNIGHVRMQECDRITAMRQGLERLQIKVEEGKDWIKIYPGQPVPSTVNSFNDHRIAMAFAIIGLKIKLEIEQADCVMKTCPEFFELWQQLSHSFS